MFDKEKTNSNVDINMYCVSHRVFMCIDTSPRDRVLQILSQLCSELSVEETFDHKLQVLEGDLTRPRLGMSEENYSSVCSRVDVIIHNGAVVNAALPYSSMLYFEVLCLQLLYILMLAVRPNESDNTAYICICTI